MRYSTPLRYPGGKSRLANFMGLVFEENNLINGHYVEPYAGGAGIALYLLFSGHASHIHINDLSKSIYAFWQVVLEDTDNICRLIHETPVDIDTWFRQKEVQAHPERHSTLELGFSTFFLNRTNRSGIISGGVIGGQNQDGPWKLDARYNKTNLISRIERISRVSDHITLYNQDAAEFITEVIPTLPLQSIVYLDPPYHAKGHDLYENHYVYDDHLTISNLVGDINQRWIVSYDDTPEIREMYQWCRNLPYQLSYSAADHYKGAEIMFFSDNLLIPTVDDPAHPQKAPAFYR
ncbi:MAG: DNA adenine methylase [Dehalococcoidia bacterium]|nr:DNA adenine methylase [Dehalococcoidia bacterium]